MLEKSPDTCTYQMNQTDREDHIEIVLADQVDQVGQCHRRQIALLLLTKSIHYPHQ